MRQPIDEQATDLTFDGFIKSQVALTAPGRQWRPKRPKHEISQMKMINTLVAAAAVAIPTLAFAHTTAMSLSTKDATASRMAAEAFYHLQDAVAAGYEPLFDCTDAGADGAMGQHYINKTYAMDGTLDVTKPDVLMYEPQADGSMHLVALEYIVFQSQWNGKDAPMMMGHQLQLKHKVGKHEVDPFYELHVWHWRDNPSGMTADYNPSVTCVHAG